MICKEISLEKKSYQIIIIIIIVIILIIILIKNIILFDSAASAVTGQVDPTVNLGVKIRKWASICQIFFDYNYSLTSSFSCTGFHFTSKPQLKHYKKVQH